MTDLPAPRPLLSREDYEAIEVAVMETARGRWFLAEYARRNRNADTTMLLEAIGSLERNLAEPSPTALSIELQRELSTMAESIQRTKIDLAHSIADATGLADPPKPERVYEDVLGGAERTDGLVANAAEHVQEIAWGLREGSHETETAQELERHALDIYRAAGQQALTTTRMRAILSVLRDIEGRLQAIMERWSDNVLLVDQEEIQRKGPSRHGQPATVLATAPGRIREDIVFLDPVPEDRRRNLRAAPVPAERSRPSPPPAAVPAADRLQRPAEDPPAGASAANPFAAIDAWPASRKLAVFI